MQVKIAGRPQKRYLNFKKINNKNILIIYFDFQQFQLFKNIEVIIQEQELILNYHLFKFIYIIFCSKNLIFKQEYYTRKITQTKHLAKLLFAVMHRLFKMQLFESIPIKFLW